MCIYINANHFSGLFLLPVPCFSWLTFPLLFAFQGPFYNSASMSSLRLGPSLPASTHGKYPFCWWENLVLF